METLDLARYFADFLINNGAEKTEIIECKNSNIFDYLVVCSAKDKYNAQVLLVQLLEYAKKEFNQVSCGLEGYKKAEWIIADFGKISVNIFQSKTREKYSMERLWRY